MPATFIAVYQQPGANGLEVSEGVRKTLAEMKSRFPEGIDYVIALDTNDFVKLSIEEVIKTLFEAIAAGRAGRLPVPAELPHDDHLHRSRSSSR